MTPSFCFPPVGLSVPGMSPSLQPSGCTLVLSTWLLSPQSAPLLNVSASSLPLCPSALLTCPSPLPLPAPHPGSLLRGVQPGTQQGTRTGSCLACFHSVHGHRAAARGGTRPRLRTPTQRLKLRQTRPPAPTPTSQQSQEVGRAGVKPSLNRSQAEREEGERGVRVGG